MNQAVWRPQNGMGNKYWEIVSSNVLVLLFFSFDPMTDVCPDENVGIPRVNVPVFLLGMLLASSRHHHVHGSHAMRPMAGQLPPWASSWKWSCAKRDWNITTSVVRASLRYNQNMNSWELP
jgi:hypothetical protein